MARFTGFTNGPPTDGPTEGAGDFSSSWTAGESPPPPPSPGWYADPAGGKGQRYWDGQQWGQTGDAPPTPSPTAPAAKDSSRRTPLLVAAGVTAAAVVTVVAWYVGRSAAPGESASDTTATTIITVTASPSSASPTTDTEADSSSGFATAAPSVATSSSEAANDRSGPYFTLLGSMGVCTDSSVAPGGRRLCKADFTDDGALLLGTQVCLGYRSGLDDDEIIALLRRQAPINTDTAEIIRLAAKRELC